MGFLDKFWIIKNFHMILKIIFIISIKSFVIYFCFKYVLSSSYELTNYFLPLYFLLINFVLCFPVFVSVVSFKKLKFALKINFFFILITIFFFGYFVKFWFFKVSQNSIDLKLISAKQNYEHLVLMEKHNYFFFMLFVWTL